MDGYSLEVEQQMGRFYRSLNERDRRRYAGIEATKLGEGSSMCPDCLGVIPRRFGRESPK